MARYLRFNPVGFHCDSEVTLLGRVGRQVHDAAGSQFNNCSSQRRLQVALK